MKSLFLKKYHEINISYFLFVESVEFFKLFRQTHRQLVNVYNLQHGPLLQTFR